MSCVRSCSLRASATQDILKMVVGIVNMTRSVPVNTRGLFPAVGCREPKSELRTATVKQQ